MRRARVTAHPEPPAQPVPSPRRSVALALLLAWFVVLGFHVRREYFPASGARLAAGARLLAPGTHFYLVRLQEQVIGACAGEPDTQPDSSAS
jgi:hypothetical protein